MAEAKQIVDNYWEGYKGVKAYYDNNIAFAEENGYVVSEFSGLTLRTPNINANDEATREREIRVLCNFLIQSSAFMLLRYLTDFMKWVEDNGYENKIKIVNSIYDSIYMYIDEDYELLAEVNKVFPEIMTRPLWEDELLHHELEMDVGRDWKDQKTLPAGATAEFIEKFLISE